ncbi:conserved hypothetical protein, partial [Ricinus communis]
ARAKRPGWSRCWRWYWYSCVSPCLAKPAQPALGQNRDDQQNALEQSRVERRNAHCEQHLLHQQQHARADHRADRAALTAAETRPAQRDGGKGQQQKRQSRVRIARGCLRAQHEAGCAIKHSCDHETGAACALHRNPRQTRGHL